MIPMYLLSTNEFIVFSFYKRLHYVMPSAKEQVTPAHDPKQRRSLKYNMHPYARWTRAGFMVIICNAMDKLMQTMKNDNLVWCIVFLRKLGTLSISA